MTLEEKLEYLKKLGHKAYIKKGKLYSNSGTPIDIIVDGKTGQPKFSTVTSKGQRVFFTNNGKFNRTGKHTPPDMRSIVEKGADWFMKNIGSPIHEAIDAYKDKPGSVLEPERSTLEKTEDATIAFAKPYGRLAKTIVQPTVSFLASGAANDSEAMAAQYMAGQDPTRFTQKQANKVGNKVGKATRQLTEEFVPYILPGINYGYMLAQGDKDRRDGNYLGMALNWAGPTGKVLGTAGKAALSTNTGKSIALSTMLNASSPEITKTVTQPTEFVRSIKRAKHLIQDGTKEAPIWFGRQHSISEVVNADGTVNPYKLRQIQKEVADQYGVKQIQFRTENPEWHKTDPNTWLHTRQVAQAAWEQPVPEGFTKQDQMFTALGHDLGKMLAGDGHEVTSAELIRQIFPDATQAQLEAISSHMKDFTETESTLARAVKIADRAGKPKGYEDQTQFIKKFKEFANKYGYEVPDIPKYDVEAWNEAAKNMLDRHNTFLRGVTDQPYFAEDIAQAKQALGENFTTEQFQQYAATHPRTWGEPGHTVEPSLFVGDQNALIYGNGKAAAVQFPYKLGENRLNWFKEGDTPIYYADGLAASDRNANNFRGLLSPQEITTGIREGNNGILAISDEPLIFRGWSTADHPVPIRTSLNATKIYSPESISNASQSSEGVVDIVTGATQKAKKAKEIQEITLSPEVLAQRENNNINAIDIYRDRLFTNGGANLIQNRGTAKYNAKDIKVAQSEEDFDKAIDKIITQDISRELPSTLYPEEKLAITNLRKEYILGLKDIEEVTKDAEIIIKDYPYLKEAVIEYLTAKKPQKLYNWLDMRSSAFSEYSEDSGYYPNLGFSPREGNFVWAPNKKTLEEILQNRKDITGITSKYWQTTLPHEFEHTFQDGIKVYESFGAKHIASPEALYNKAEYMTPELMEELVRMSKEMDTLIGIQPTTQYLVRPTELLARGTQIKNWLGITNPHYQLTAKDLKEAAAYYTKTGNDNNMNQFFSMITDWEKAAKFLSKASCYAGGFTLFNNARNYYRKGGKFDIGGTLGNIADSIDEKLDSLGTVGRSAVEAVDSTGITGWKDTKEAYQNFQQDHSVQNAGMLLLGVAGSTPMLGGYFRKLSKAVKAAKAIKTAEKTSKIAEVTAKFTLKSNPVREDLAREATKVLSKEAPKDSEILKVSKDIYEALSSRKILPKEVLGEPKLVEILDKKASIDFSDLSQVSAKVSGRLDSLTDNSKQKLNTILDTLIDSNPSKSKSLLSLKQFLNTNDQIPEEMKKFLTSINKKASINYSKGSVKFSKTSGSQIPKEVEQMLVDLGNSIQKGNLSQDWFTPKMWAFTNQQFRGGFQKFNLYDQVESAMRDNFSNLEYIDFLEKNVSAANFNDLDLLKLDTKSLENLVKEFKNPNRSVEEVFNLPQFKKLFFDKNGNFKYNVYGQDIPDYLKDYYLHSNMQLARLALIQQYLAKRLPKAKKITFSPLFKFENSNTIWRTKRPGMHLDHYGFVTGSGDNLYPLEAPFQMRDLRSYTLSPKVQLHHLTPLQKQISDVLLHDEEGLLLRQRLLQGDPTVIEDIVAKHRELNSGPRYHKNFLLLDQPFHTGKKSANNKPGIHNVPGELDTTSLQKLNKAMLQDYYRLGMPDELASDVLLNYQSQLNKAILGQAGIISQKLEAFIKQQEELKNLSREGNIFVDMPSYIQSIIDNPLQAIDEEYYQYMGKNLRKHLNKYLNTRQQMEKTIQKAKKLKEIAAEQSLDLSDAFYGFA